MSQYFEYDPSLKDDIKHYEYTFKGKQLSFSTNSGIFSKERVDFGTNVLLNGLDDLSNKKDILDLGCGNGIIGIAIKKAYPTINVVMADVNQKCIEISKENAIINKVDVDVIESDMYQNINSSFDLILSNPPIRAGKKKVFEVVEEGYQHLRIGGEIICVIQKKQGAESLLKRMEEIFNNAIIIKKEKGYYLIKSTKKE